jgi:phosphatidylinositol-3-phosphatase
MLKNLKIALGLSAAMFVCPAIAKEGYTVAADVGRLQHVYLIMMENHGFGQVIGNPDLPFTNAWAHHSNLAYRYFAVGHPSFTNYVEILGGSNFGIRSDNSPDWRNASCQPNLMTGQPNLDGPTSSGPVCPIAGVGTDAATPAVDCTNEYSGGVCGNDIDGVRYYNADANIDGKSIADQLAASGLTIKDYQENIPGNPDGVNYSDGQYSNLTDFAKLNSEYVPALSTPLSTSNVVQLYAVKHNPFAYFANNQTGHGPVPYSAMVGFDGPNGLFADLATGKTPTFSYIVPNQCHDQHGRGNAGPFCAYDQNDQGTLAGLNPALMQAGDQEMQKIVTAIKASPSWQRDRSAIIAVWDENDYSNQPNVNRVALIVDANFGPHGVRSFTYYNSFSLLKTIEGALGLPCLNHACDANTAAMTDLLVNDDPN